MAFKINANNIAGNILKGRSIKKAILSGLSISGKAGVLLRSLVGTMTRANVHISNVDTGESVSLAWTPEKITVNTSGRFASYNIIEKGEVKIPRGMNLTSIKWSAKLPGESRKNYSFVNSTYWQEPRNVIKLFEKWHENRNKLRLLITQTSVNMDVYLDDFNYDWSGGHGDADYSIAFISARDMQVKTVKEVDAEKTLQADDGENTLNTRPESNAVESVITKENSSLWSIAQNQYEDGAKWSDLYSLNADKLNGETNDVPVGISLKLP